MHRLCKVIMRYCMRLQDFPYNFDRGMQHHNIWCTRPLSDEEIAEVCGMFRSAPLAIFLQ